MKSLLLCLAAAIVLAAPAVAAPPDPAVAGWERGQAYDRLYDATLEVVLPAVVTKVEKFTPREGMAEGVRAQVEYRGELLWVHLAPAAWLAAQRWELAVGEPVTITGAYLKVDGERVVLAARVDRAGKVLRLRDETGKPEWNHWRPRPA